MQLRDDAATYGAPEFTRTTRVAPALLAATLVIGAFIALMLGAPTQALAAETQAAGSSLAAAAIQSPDADLAASNPVALKAQASKTYKSGKYKYKIRKDGTVIVKKYVGNRNVTKLKTPARLGGRKVTLIGKSAFSGLEKLKTLTIPKGVTRIGDSAFSGCYRLKVVNLPSTLKTVDGWAFYGAPIKNLKLPNKLTKIEWFAFGYTQCVTLPKNMKTFEWRNYVSGDGTCTLGEIKVAKGSKYFTFENGVLYNKKKTKLVYYLPMNSNESFVVPKTVKVIDQFAFDFCFSLNKVKLGKNVTTIRQGAFAGTSVGETFTLPSKVKKLGPSSISNSVKTLEVKTKKLTAASVKDSLKDSQVSTVIVNVSSNYDVNQKYAEKYRAIFTEENTGKSPYVYAAW